MKIPDDKWALAVKMLTKLRLAADTHQRAVEGLMIDCESPLIAPMWSLESLLVEAVSAIVGDQWGNVSWWVSECDYGRKPKVAGARGSTRNIATLDDLRWLIEVAE